MTGKADTEAYFYPHTPLVQEENTGTGLILGDTSRVQN
jgi:hypothetical protein